MPIGETGKPIDIMVFYSDRALNLRLICEQALESAERRYRSKLEGAEHCAAKADAPVHVVDAYASCNNPTLKGNIHRSKEEWKRIAEESAREFGLPMARSAGFVKAFLQTVTHNAKQGSTGGQLNITTTSAILSDSQRQELRLQAAAMREAARDAHQAACISASTQLALALGLSRPRDTVTSLTLELFAATRRKNEDSIGEAQRWIEAIQPWVDHCTDGLKAAEIKELVWEKCLAGQSENGLATSFRLRVCYLDRRLHAALEFRPSFAHAFATPRHRRLPGLTLATARRIGVIAEEDAAAEVIGALGLNGWQESSLRPYEWTTDDILVAGSLQSLEIRPDLGVSIEWQTPRPKILQAPDPVEIRLTGARSMNWFEIDGDLEVSGHRITLVDLVRAVRTGVKYIQVDSNEFLKISAHLIEILTPWARLAESDGMLQVGRLAALATASQIGLCLGDLGREVTAMKSAMLEHADLPAAAAHLNLHGYQQDGVRWMLRLSRWAPGCCLADDMGLGKTRQVLCVLAERASRGPALVVAPASLVEHWACGPDTALLASASGGLRFVQAADAAVGPGSVVVLSYDKAAKVSDLLAQRTWATVVYDEAHYLKNPGARRTKALLKVKADFTVAATGTPLENHIGEFWSIAQFFAPGWLGTRAEFRKRFLTSDEDQQRVEASALAKLLPLFVLRRRKGDHIASLPDLLEYHEEIEMHPDEAKQYGEKLMLADKAVQTTLATLPEAQKHIAALELLRQLREAAAHPSLVDDVHGDHSSKVDWLVEQLVQDREDGCKALVFSQWTRVLDRLERVLGARGVETTRLDGAMTQGRRAEAVRLIEDGRADVLLLTLGAGAVGLNLQAANRVYLFDPWWNPQKELQAICRAHRQGQRKEVVAIHMIAPRTVEQKLVELQGSKKDVFDAVMDGAEITLKLTTEEILGLLDGRSFARR